MHKPDTAFASFTQPRTPLQRFTSVAIVAGIHLAAITALIVGLNVKFVKNIPPITDTRIIPATPTKPADPPKPVHVVFTTPAQATAPEPKIIFGPDKSGITVTPGKSDGEVQLASTSVSGIMATHSIPPYPPISRRLGHEGVVLLKLMISPEGNITAVGIETSSGYADLDDMAANWVKAHWRYRAALVAGVPVASMAEASVRFSLKDAR